jgi:hypothetical protein
MRPIVVVAVVLAGVASTSIFANAGAGLASSHAVAGQAACHWEAQNV